MRTRRIVILTLPILLAFNDMFPYGEGLFAPYPVLKLEIQLFYRLLAISPWVPSQLPAMSRYPQHANCPWVHLALKRQTSGSLFYPTTTACHLTLLLRRACGRSAECTTIGEPTGSGNRQLSVKIMSLSITNVDMRNCFYIYVAYANINVCSS